MHAFYRKAHHFINIAIQIQDAKLIQRFNFKNLTLAVEWKNGLLKSPEDEQQALFKSTTPYRVLNHPAYQKQAEHPNFWMYPPQA